MNHSHGILNVALQAVERLPRLLRRQLAEQLIAETTPDADTAVVRLRRLSPQKQQRLAKLMDKNNEGGLSQAERAELKRLGVEVEHMLLANSHALARGLRPELFDERGGPIRRRFRQALRDVSPRRAQPKRVNARA